MDKNYTVREKCYKFADLTPVDTKKVRSQKANYAINSVALAMDMDWKTSYEMLIKNAHELCVMPKDQKCINAFLAENGFERHHLESKDITVDEFCEMMDKNCRRGHKAVINISEDRNKCMVAVVYDEEREHFVAKGKYLDVDSVVKAAWIRRENDENTPAKNKSVSAYSSKVIELKSKRSFKFHQENPKNNRIGDCAVRGFSSACGINWHESVDKLCESSKYGHVMINSISVLNDALLKMGFSRHSPIRVNGRLLTGEEFCIEMTRTCKNGERIFALCGTTHAVAVLPVVNENGAVSYKIHDTWDSTQRKIGDYWIKRGDNTLDCDADCKELSVGASVSHPVYGEGSVTAVDGEGDNRVLEIDFGSEGVKKLSSLWVNENCG